MSVLVLSGNFGIKLVLSQNWGACVNPKFWRVRKLPMSLLRRRRDSRICGSTKRSYGGISQLEGCQNKARR